MDYDYLKVSDGTGDAALMNITAARAIGSTTISVDSVTGVPPKFIATSGTKLPNGLLDPATVTNFKGHLVGSQLAIDSFEPGSSDIGNLASGQAVIIKPNTGWSNRVAYFIQNLTGFGTPQPLTLAALTATAINAVSAVFTNNVRVGGSLTVIGSTQISGTSSLVGATVVTADGGGKLTPTSQAFSVSALSNAATINIPTYAPAGLMSGIILIRDNGTAQGLSWATGWVPIGLTLPTATLGGSKNIYVSYVYNPFSSTFEVVGISRQA